MTGPDSRATGVGSWPGTDSLEAARTVVGELGVDPGLPYLPELPDRGPGADLIGRGAAMLVEMPVDLQPSGWRLVGRGGRDLHRAQTYLTSDIDALAEAADGYRGPLKVTACGPWTLAGALWLPRGERVVTDRGATRDLAQSLAAGLGDRLRAVARAVPGAQLVVQLDEPSLSAVLAGRLTTASGLGRVRAVETGEASAALRGVAHSCRLAGAASVVVHCRADDPPLPTLRDSGADALSLDLASVSGRVWEGLAVAVESGTRLVAGVIDPTRPTVPTSAVVQSITRPWRSVGLTVEQLRWVDVSPVCGLAGVSPTLARQLTTRTVEVARALTEIAAQG